MCHTGHIFSRFFSPGTRPSTAVTGQVNQAWSSACAFSWSGCPRSTLNDRLYCQVSGKQCPLYFRLKLVFVSTEQCKLNHWIGSLWRPAWRFVEWRYTGLGRLPCGPPPGTGKQSLSLTSVQSSPGWLIGWRSWRKWQFMGVISHGTGFSAFHTGLLSSRPSSAR